MSGDMEETRESADSADNDKKRKRPESAGLQFVNITHPDQSKTKAVLKTVRQHAMNSHLYRNNSPDLDERERVSRLPRRLRSLLNRSIVAPMPESRPQRAASVPQEVDSAQFLATRSDERQSRRVSSVDVFRQPSPPRKPQREQDLLSEEQTLARQPSPPAQYGADLSYPYRPRQDYDEHLQMLSRNCAYFFGTHQLESMWKPRGREDRLFYLSSLCVAAKHTEAHYGTSDNLYNLALDAQVVQTINEKMRDPREQTSDNTIAVALHIAICYNYGVPSRFDWYNLICTLVELRGGLDQLDTFPGLSSAILINGIASAIFQETIPHQMFLSRASSALRSPSTTRRLESPINWPSTGSGHLANSVKCSKQLFALLQHVRHVISIVTAESTSPSARKAQYQTQKNGIRSHLLTFPQGTSTKGGSAQREHSYIYESCRIAAIILERALHYSKPLSEAVKGKDLLHSLQDVLLKTDLDNCWGELAGPLLWVSYVGAAASNDVEVGDDETRQLRAWLVGCATRVTIKNAFASGSEIIRSLYTFARVQEVCALKD